MQLKKYVGAVQMLRREGQTVEGKDELKGEKSRNPCTWFGFLCAAIEMEFTGGICIAASWWQ